MITQSVTPRYWAFDCIVSSDNNKPESQERFAIPDDSPLSDRDTASQKAPLRGRALIMDDEELVRNVARRTLIRRGLEVDVAADAEGACELFAAAQRQGCPFQVVILDLTIPGGGGGLEALQQLLKLDPALKAIVCSGYSNDPVFADYRSHGFFSRVRKPFHPEELVAAVRSALEAEGAD